MPNGEGILRTIEKKLGLPNLDSVSRSLNQFPDAKQLKLIKDVLTVAERVAQTGPELEKVVELIRELNSTSTEKLERVEKILKRVDKILKNAPQDLLGFLSSLKEE